MSSTERTVRAAERRRPWRLAGLGLLLALLLAALDALGLFRGPERRSVDLRAAAMPRPARPMTDRIAHVDIDDGALDRIGRWPWDRATLADAIDELGRAGAKTIALDLIFSEKQRYANGTAPDVDHDQRFADALGHTHSIVPVVLHEGMTFDDTWTHGDGPAELDRLMQVLADDIQTDDPEAAQRAGLSDTRRARYLERPLAFKKAAAWRAIAQIAPPDWASFEEAITPTRSAIGGAYPEQPMLRTVWTQHTAWKTLTTRLLEPDGHLGTHQDVAPLPLFAARASAVGFVNFESGQDSDGRVRELPVLRQAPGGTVLQFGVAAALAHQGLAPDALEVEGDRLRAGDVELPLRDGRLWIAWPTSQTEPRWKGLLDRGTRQDGTDGHISIREIIELSRARRTRDRLKNELAAVTRLVFAGAEIAWDGGHLDAEAQGLAADEVDFTIAETLPSPATPADQHAEPFGDHIHNCRTWRELTTAIADAHTRIDDASDTLRTAVEGRLVFVGWTATAVAADFCATAVGPTTPGVVVHAALADMMLTGRAVRFLSAGSNFWLILLPALTCALLAARCSALPSILGAVGILLAYAGVAAWAFAGFDLAIPMVAPLTTSAVVWVAGTALEAWLSQRDRLRITRQFKSRVSGTLVDYLVANPRAVTVDGIEREVTVMFGDLANFTTLSESLGGPNTVRMLNRYLPRLADAIVANDGYVNKFLGDGFMAFWSAFEPDPEQARKACAAIVACRDAINRLNDESRTLGDPELELRIGIATGRVVVGDCGAPPSMHDYTVIGDAVNLAARLESANKQFGTANLIDGRTGELLGADTDRVRPIGRISVVGQAAAVEAFEVMPTGCSEVMVDLSRRIVNSFTDGQFDEASATLDTLESTFGPTKWSERYRRAIHDSANAASFDGTLQLQEK